MDNDGTNNKKLYSFRFNEGLIAEIDEIAKTTHRTRTQLITDLMVAHKLSHPHPDEPIRQPLDWTIAITCSTTT